MAFVRRRTTTSGDIFTTPGVCTTLIESYRDTSGRPRQRILANLYGEATPLEALAKLAAHREQLREEKAGLDQDLKGADNFYRWFTTASLDGQKFSADEKKEIDRLLPERERLIGRAKKVDVTLARIAKDGAAIKKHCNSSSAEIQAAIRKYKKALRDDEMVALAVNFHQKEIKKASRRFSI